MTGCDRVGCRRGGLRGCVGAGGLRGLRTSRDKFESSLSCFRRVPVCTAGDGWQIPSISPKLLTQRNPTSTPACTYPPCVRAPSQPKFGWGPPIALLDQDPLPFAPFLLLSCVSGFPVHVVANALFIPPLSRQNLVYLIDATHSLPQSTWLLLNLFSFLSDSKFKEPSPVTGKNYPVFPKQYRDA